MGRKFQFEWRTAAFVMVLLPIMVNLGFWQLQRADENRKLQQVAERQRQQQPLPLVPQVENQLIQDVASDTPGLWHLQQVSIQGQWLDRYFLLENQMNEGRNGYHVIGVMKLADGKFLLVNRGWIIAPSLRSELPAVPSVVQAAIEVGEVYAAPQVLRESPVYAETGWPRRIGKLNVPGLAHELGLEVLPVVVRLQEGSPSALTARWPVVNISPEKNIAYAIQWFAMSVALVIFYIALSFRREATNDGKNEALHG
jgi:cytochrome oxidase assembly protein ShyY1